MSFGIHLIQQRSPVPRQRAGSGAGGFPSAF